MDVFICLMMDRIISLRVPINMSKHPIKDDLYF